MVEYNVWHAGQLPKKLQKDANGLMHRQMRYAYAQEGIGTIKYKLIHVLAEWSALGQGQRPRMVLTEGRGEEEKVVAVVDYNPLRSTVNEIASAKKSENEKKHIEESLGKTAAEELLLHLIFYLKKIHAKNYADAALLGGGHHLASRLEKSGFKVVDQGKGVHRIYFPERPPERVADAMWRGRYDKATSRR